MKRSAIFIFGLLSTLAVDAACAAEVQFSCNYELGAEQSAQRKRIGSVVVAIDVNAKTARIDFGKGWFKSMSLMVDGTDVKETSPPSNGDELGYFYFDLNGNSGGFRSDSDPHEFFDACMRVAPGGEQSADQSATPAPGLTPPASSDAAAASPAVKPQPAPPAMAQAQIETPEDRRALKKAVPLPLPQVAQVDVPKEPSAPVAPPVISPPAASTPPPLASAAPNSNSSEMKAPDVRGVASEAAAAPTQQADAVPPPAALAPVLPSSTVAAAPAEDAPLPSDVHGTTENFDGKSSRIAEATISEAAAVAAAAGPTPAPAVEGPPPAAAPVPPAGSLQAVQGPSEAHGTTAYFGGGEAEKKSLPGANVPVAQVEAPQFAPATSPPAAPVHEAALESCRDMLGAEARSATVNFENSSFSIVSGSQVELRKIAKMMKDCGAVSIEVRGHADNLGDHGWNKKLSFYRANAVVDFLVREGAIASSLKAVGYGDEQPIATNETDEGRRSNRRVELRVSAP